MSDKNQKVEADQDTQQKHNHINLEFDEHEEFAAIASTEYITSTDFCRSVAAIFKSVFADFEGCRFEVGNGIPYISLVFNHNEHDADAIVGCQNASIVKSTGNSILDRSRAHDRMMKDGDRYLLTEDGKDIIKPLLIPRAFNQGKPDWRHIVTEYVDRASYTVYNPTHIPQYTLAQFLDLNRLAGLVYGTKINDDTVQYDVNIVGALNKGYQFNGSQIQSEYILSITQVSAKEINAIYEKLGFVNANSNIVR